MDPRLVPAWSTDWAWGLPLIVFTVVLHGYGLGLLSKEVNVRLSSRKELRHPSYISIYVIGGTALSATMLHGIEAFMEALNGWILFGLTTAFLFSVVQKAWPHTYAGPAAGR
jgi:hypothetical protein